MVEHTVEDNLNALSVAFLYKICQIRIVTQTAVKLLVISCFIAVSDKLKKRSDIDRIAANLFDVADPGKGLVQAMYRCCIGVFLRCITKS